MELKIKLLLSARWRKLTHLRWGDRLEAVYPSRVANPLSAGELVGSNPTLAENRNLITRNEWKIK